MRIISTLLPGEPNDLMPGKNVVLMLFDTLVNDKSLVVGITVGSMEGSNLSEVKVSPVGQQIVNRMGEHINRNYPDAVVICAGVASTGGAVERVRKVLTKAPPGAAVLLLCTNDKVYDAAFKALGFDPKSMHTDLQ